MKLRLLPVCLFNACGNCYTLAVPVQPFARRSDFRMSFVGALCGCKVTFIVLARGVSCVEANSDEMTPEERKFRAGGLVALIGDAQARLSLVRLPAAPTPVPSVKVSSVCCSSAVG